MVLPDPQPIGRPRESVADIFGKKARILGNPQVVARLMLRLVDKCSPPPRSICLFVYDPLLFNHGNLHLWDIDVEEAEASCLRIRFRAVSFHLVDHELLAGRIFVFGAIQRLS